MTDKSPIKLRLPSQDLDHFDSFALERDAVLAWADNLPLTNVRAVAQQLIQVVGELNRVAMTPPTRHSVMEALRPTIDTALTNLICLISHFFSLPVLSLLFFLSLCVYFHYKSTPFLHHFLFTNTHFSPLPLPPLTHFYLVFF